MNMSHNSDYYPSHGTASYQHYGTLQPAGQRHAQPYRHAQPQSSHPFYQRAYSVQGYHSNDMASEMLPARGGAKPGQHEMMSSKSVDYSESSGLYVKQDAAAVGGGRSRRSRSRSIEDVQRASGKNDANALSLDSNALKRMLQPVQSVDTPPTSPLTSPEVGRRSVASAVGGRFLVNDGFQSEPESSR